jgi:hypothetical protein
MNEYLLPNTVDVVIDYRTKYRFHIRRLFRRGLTPLQRRMHKNQAASALARLERETPKAWTWQGFIEEHK